MKPMQGQQQGFSLLLAMSVIVLLTLLGIMVLKTVTADLALAGSDRSSQAALYTAEAGVYWGLDKLRDDYGFDGDTPQYDIVLSGTVPAVSAGDAACQHLSGTCTDWRELTAGSEGFGDASFRVFVRDDDEADGDSLVDSNATILMWALGVDQHGAKRMIEVVLSTRE